MPSLGCVHNTIYGDTISVALIAFHGGQGYENRRQGMPIPGGGYLVFGVSDDKRLEPCEQFVGGQTMKDFLMILGHQTYCVRWAQGPRTLWRRDGPGDALVQATRRSGLVPGRRNRFGVLIATATLADRIRQRSPRKRCGNRRASCHERMPDCS